MKSQQSPCDALPAALCGHLGLVADSGQAAMVDESEHALAVVARDELHGNADAVDVCVARATSHLKMWFKKKKKIRRHETNESSDS